MRSGNAIPGSYDMARWSYESGNGQAQVSAAEYFFRPQGTFSRLRVSNQLKTAVFFPQT